MITTSSIWIYHTFHVNLLVSSSMTSSAECDYTSYKSVDSYQSARVETGFHWTIGAYCLWSREEIHQHVQTHRCRGWLGGTTAHRQESREDCAAEKDLKRRHFSQRGSCITPKTLDQTHIHRPFTMGRNTGLPVCSQSKNHRGRIQCLCLNRFTSHNRHIPESGGLTYYRHDRKVRKVTTLSIVHSQWTVSVMKYSLFMVGSNYSIGVITGIFLSYGLGFFYIGICQRRFCVNLLVTHHKNSSSVVVNQSINFWTSWHVTKGYWRLKTTTGNRFKRHRTSPGQQPVSPPKTFLLRSVYAPNLSLRNLTSEAPALFTR